MALERAASRWLLSAGILLRIFVFIFLQPINNDDHGEVVRFIVKYGRLPTVANMQQGQHPPLYYLIAAPILKATGNYKFVQLLSLWFSICALLVLYHLVYHTDLLQSARARTYGFLVACFLPQFVMFSLYLSNDSLTILLGNLVILQMGRAIQRPVMGQWILLAILTALGMLTKLTLLAFVPVLCGLVFWTKGRGRRGLLAAIAFGVLVMTLGGYKLAENMVHFGRPMPTNMDPEFHVRFAREHALTYKGLASYLDFNVFRLVREPILGKATNGSYPVIFYATFWYQYIPESNFVLNRTRPTMYLGSVIYMLALFPTGVFLLGLWASFRAKWTEGVGLGRLACVLIMLCTGLMFLPALMKYHVWSIVQARYLFPAMFGCLVTFGAGVEIVERNRAASLALGICMAVLTGIFVTYFVMECAHWM
jgi:4-amino-4-deoxy-L-arabinose transferase-like glycosyltransferase